MNSSFFFSVTGCVCSLIYVLSLLINVQFRGDFGLLADTSIRSSGMSQFIRKSIGGGSVDENSSIEEFLDVPIGDITLLFSPSASPNARLHNVKVDLKEV